MQEREGVYMYINVIYSELKRISINNRPA